ncbi:MAG: hypothetical protein CUN56_11735 [Phototrophicales bacterium]|nr:MAG: hypothetical protein CUN56_11735 [Phototrophicales bacterium]RMG77834.1 MAG: zinc ribbon domain-containing protein [Chloroflexota bacterium]
MNTQLIQHILSITNWDQATRMQVLMEAQQAVISGSQDEVAMTTFTALAPRNDTWRQFINQFITLYPENPLAQTWRNYLRVFQSPHNQPGISQLINQISTGNIPTHPPANIKPEEWAAVVDIVHKETGQTINTPIDFTQQLIDYVRALSTPQPTSPTNKNATPSEPVYEMLWDCRFCGTKKLLGKSQKFCPVCGAAQDPSWRYFPSDDEKVAVQDHKFVGTDVECPACSTLNSGDSTYCTRCGSPLDAAQAVKVQSAREKHESEKFQTEDLQARIHREYDAEAGRIQPEASKKGGLPRWMVMGGGLALLGLCFFLIYVLFFAKEERSVYVTGFEWERTIEIQQLRAVNENTRCENMPAGAYSVDRRREQVDTRRVQVGEDCRVRQVDQGDGTFREERVCNPVYENEPVYGDVCYYTINRWLDDRTLREEGTKDDTVVWPQVNLACTGERLGCEREGQRDESYVLILAGDGDSTYECEIDFDLWQSTNIEAVFTIQVNSVTGRADCGSLESASSG